MEFKKEIESKSKQLIEKAKKLPLIKIKWERPIQVNCTNIEKSLFKLEIDILKKNRRLPCVYYFKIKSKNSAKDVVNELKTFKDKKLRSCPQIDNRSLKSKFLYCGSIKDEAHGRFIQHLGFSSPGTFALQLKHWAGAIDLHLEFHHAFLEKEYVGFTELVESALSAKLKPLVGKQEI
jgi:hypothetical protein